MSEKKALTASEIAETWGAYMNASLSVRVLSYFLKKTEDEKILGIIQDAYDMSVNHLKILEQFLLQDGHEIPIGFTEEDVNVDAPKLYTDNYMLQNVMQFGILGMIAASAGIGMASREDIYSHFSKAHHDYNELHRKALQTAKEKAIYNHPPIIPTTKAIDFVKKQNFITGWFGERRPLLTVEIANLFSNIERNALGAATLIGFSQIAQATEVKDFLLRGIDIAKKHVTIFSNLLKENDIPTPSGSDAMVTDSSEIAPFSDRLIMFHTTGMIAQGIGFYGYGISTNTRKDLATTYMRLCGEIALYAEDGANIMIDHGWMEEPPRMIDREELVKKKGEKS